MICGSASLCFGIEVIDIVSDFIDKKESEPGWETFTGEKKLIEAEPYTVRDFEQFFEAEERSSPTDPVSIEAHFFGAPANRQESLLTADPHSVRPPHFSREENPIDYIGGGLDAAKGDKMKTSLRRAARGDVYRYLVGLEAVSPLTASVMKQIQSFANQLNAMSLHSYESSAALVPGLWPKAERASAYLCQHTLLADGDATDWIDATYQCQDRNVRRRMLQKAGKSKQMIAGTSNVAAKILSSLGFHPPAVDLLINLTGTVVVKEDDEMMIFPSQHRQVIAFWQQGQTIDKAYLLEQDNVSMKRGALTSESSEAARILCLLQGMQQKLRTDAPFSSIEKKLFATSYFPMGTWITLMTQYKGNGSQLVLERCSEILAGKRVMQLAQEVVTNVLHKAESLQFSQISGYELDLYIKQLHGVLQDLKDSQEIHDRNLTTETDSLTQLLLSAKAHF